MENAVDKNFDRLEIWTLRNVLCLPRGEEELVRWMRLGGYEVSYTPAGGLGRLSCGKALKIVAKGYLLTKN
jgi:hypothetical protein